MIKPHGYMEWIHVDTELDIMMPWYTKPFLQELATWDLSDTVLFEYGIGNSTIWYAHKCKYVFGVEEKFDWADSVQIQLRMKNLRNSLVKFAPNKQSFINAIDGLEGVNMVAVDGDYWRDECIISALNVLEKNGGTLIIDNWLQPSVWIASDEVQLKLNKYEAHIFKQPGHDDWQTAYFIIK